MNKFIFFLTGIAAIFVSCSGRKTAGNESGDTLKLKYSRLLTIVDFDDRTEIAVADPWHKGRILNRYSIAKGKSYDRAVVFTTVHCALINRLGVLGKVAGVCDLRYIKVPEVLDACRKGDIADCGNSMQADIEKIADIGADAILLSPFENSGGYGKLSSLGIPVIECADYMETSPLGRAEWMKFYGRIFGCAQRADSLFEVVEKNYLSIKEKACSGGGSGKTVMMDKMTGSVWYVPGGESTMARMIADAGGDYIFREDTHSGSLALNFETVFDRCKDADIWLYRYENNPDLASEKSAYREFRAYKTGQLWGCDVSRSAFYEDTPFRPDFLLAEFAKIFDTGEGGRYFMLSSCR